MSGQVSEAERDPEREGAPPPAAEVLDDGGVAPKPPLQALDDGGVALRPPLEQAPPAPAPPAAEPLAPRTSRLQIALALIGGALVVAVNVTLVETHVRPESSDPGAATSSSAPALSQTQALAPSLPPTLAPSGDPSSDPDAPPPPDATDTPKDEPAPEDRGKKGKSHTVQWAAERACSTSHVDGLSRQIIEESRCLDHNAFARVPARKNLSGADHVFLYLDAPARDHLVRALDAHPNRTMKVHSALRTVAQQYLLSRWGAGHRCGIQLATRPGESNHETGLALDVADHGAWRTALESEGFKWLGSIDRVHFDFVGPGATHHDGLDVRAFQRLWNRNHPDDAISESGRYDGATEQRLKRSPSNGFPTGALCGGAREHRLASGGSARAHGR